MTWQCAIPQQTIRPLAPRRSDRVDLASTAPSLKRRAIEEMVTG